MLLQTNYAHAVNASVKKIERFCRAHFGGRMPTIAIMPGTGLHGLAELLEDRMSVPCADFGIPAPEVEGHAPVVTFGWLSGKFVMVIPRFHIYEEQYADFNKIAHSTRVAVQLGVKFMILTNAVGICNTEIKPGSVVMIKDHLSYLADLGGLMRGPIETAQGQPFVDVAALYPVRLRNLARLVHNQLPEDVRTNAPLIDGRYVIVPGRCFQTPMEAQFLNKAVGADIVGMSIVPEVVSAKQLGFDNVLALSVTTDVAGVAGTNHDVVRDNAARAAKCLEAIVAGVVERLD